LINKMQNSRKHYAKDFAAVKQIIQKINPVDSVLLFIGAGDIDDLARELID